MLTRAAPRHEVLPIHLSVNLRVVGRDIEANNPVSRLVVRSRNLLRNPEGLNPYFIHATQIKRLAPKAARCEKVEVKISFVAGTEAPGALSSARGFVFTPSPFPLALTGCRRALSKALSNALLPL